VNAVGINEQGLLIRKDPASWMPGAQNAGPDNVDRGASTRYQMGIEEIFFKWVMDSGGNTVHLVDGFLANMQFCNIYLLRFCIFISAMAPKGFYMALSY